MDTTPRSAVPSLGARRARAPRRSIHILLANTSTTALLLLLLAYARPTSPTTSLPSSSSELCIEETAACYDSDFCWDCVAQFADDYLDYCEELYPALADSASDGCDVAFAQFCCSFEISGQDCVGDTVTMDLLQCGLEESGCTFSESSCSSGGGVPAPTPASAPSIAPAQPATPHPSTAESPTPAPSSLADDSETSPPVAPTPTLTPSTAVAPTISPTPSAAGPTPPFSSDSEESQSSSSSSSSDSQDDLPSDDGDGDFASGSSGAASLFVTRPRFSRCTTVVGGASFYDWVAPTAGACWAAAAAVAAAAAAASVAVIV